MSKNYLIAYDIADKKRLAKVRKVTYAYALGGQKSALEAPLDKKTKTSWCYTTDAFGFA